MNYLFFYQKMSVGGCQLLIKKIATNLKQHGYGAYVFCESIDEQINNELKNSGVVVVKSGTTGWYDDNHIKCMIKSDTHFHRCRVTTFIWSDYIRCLSLFGKNCKIMFYAVHSFAINRACQENGIIGHLHRFFLKSTITSHLKSKLITVMDEQTAENAISHYKIPSKKLRCSDCEIIRIPVDTSDILDIDNCTFEKYNDDVWNILAVARADFPFKGYLLGLVRLVKKGLIPIKYNVTIISYGDDYSILEKEILSSDRNQNNRIRLIGKVDYDELKAYFEKSHIYVGMGTTILDSSKYGVISIPVVAYTDKVLANNFFHEDYSNVALKNGSENEFINLLAKFEVMNETERYQAIIKSQEIVLNHYSTEACTNHIISSFDSQKKARMFVARIEYFFRIIKRKIRNK